MTVETLLLDLDGTLVDTAPDLGSALNRLRAEHNLPELSATTIRPWVSRGARGLLEIGFSVDETDPSFDTLRTRLLDLYETNLSQHSVLFDGMAAVLAHFESNARNWGIVTNKPARFTDPLVRALGLVDRACCIVSGDTTEHAKPHPAPILHAIDIAQLDPDTTLYVGDAKRDIEAGRAAGLRTVAAAWGYTEIEPPVTSWSAHLIADTPRHLLQLIG